MAWNARSVPAGMTVQPASGSLSVAAGDRAQVGATLQTSGAARGLWNLPFAATAANGALVPVLTYAVRVEDSGAPLRLAYIQNRFDNTITPFDPATGAIGAAFAAGSEPRDAVFSPDGHFLYVSDRAGKSLAIVDTATQGVSFVKVGQSPNGTAVTPDGKTVWVANYDDSTIQPIDVLARTAGKPIAAGLNPRWIAVAPDGRTLYVSNQNGNTVTPFSYPPPLHKRRFRSARIPRASR